MQNNREIIKNNLINNFIPTKYITLDSEYIITLIVISILGNIIINMKNSHITWVLSIVLLVYNVIHAIYLKRQHIRITQLGLLLTTALVYIAYIIWFTLISKNSLVITLFKGFGIGIKCYITQQIAYIIVRIQERNEIKRIKNISKQMNKYENKINKIMH